MTKLGLCLSCDRFFEVKGAIMRCDNCRDVLDYRGKFGSSVVVGVVTQRELAQMKREYFQVESLVSALEERKAEFMKRALEQAEQLVKDVEAQIGQPVAELRAKRDLLQTKIQEYMQESGNTRMVIRNLLLELKREVTNPGNRPQPTKIYEELRKLAGLTQEELQEIVRANYSQPQFGDVMHVTKLPPGRRKQKQMAPPPPPTGVKPPTASRHTYEIDELTLPAMAEIHKEFSKTAAEQCRIDSTEDGVFILTGDLVRENGLLEMVSRQRQTKASLRVADMEQRDDNHVLVLVEGQFAYDPNTVRAFLAERLPTHEAQDALLLTETRIAVEMAPMGAGPADTASAYFDQMDQILTNLMAAERARSQVAHGIMGYVTGANQMDLVDNVDDLETKYELKNTNPEGTGASVPRAQEGIMSPERDPNSHSFFAAGCATCKREMTASARDPINPDICVWCGLESENARA